MLFEIGKNVLIVAFCLCLVICLGLIGWYSFLYGITPTPSSRKVVSALLQLSPTLSPGESIAELGSGWGNLAFALARKYPWNPVIAYEISPIPYLTSKIIASLLRLPNLKIVRKNFFDISLHNHSLIVCYLFPNAMIKLKNKFEAELEHAYVLSHTFAIPKWKPVKMMHVQDLYRTPIYLYRTRT